MLDKLIIDYLPWLLSAISIWMNILMGYRKPYVWLIGLANQLLWSLWILYSHHWGFLPMNIAMWFIFTRNHYLWKEQERLKQEKKLRKQQKKLIVRDAI